MTVQITDAQGRFPNHAYDREPEPASVVLTHGEFGNAWQRYFSDGLWHRGKHVKTWGQLVRERNVLLAYDAPIRQAPCPACGYADNHDNGQCPALPSPGCRACEMSGVTCHNHKEVSV